jgi:hypothetical protein
MDIFPVDDLLTSNAGTQDKTRLTVQLLFSYSLLIAGALTTLVFDMKWQCPQVKRFQE